MTDTTRTAAKTAGGSRRPTEPRTARDALYDPRVELLAGAFAFRLLPPPPCAVRPADCRVWPWRGRRSPSP
ncbi:hypothetical protein [Streptomyces sp. CNQ085]|uniref:hypothetical protein n=1 Tax=Streptomyces sp. CNQ085 TaxID=2886944 RepID=UPI001F50AB14|nr:hypothetical protein [Streptomyces sp. CNQ085]MCI0383497.1 hypothetical protein [Streptomyces sp. CNQ085]